MLLRVMCLLVGVGLFSSTAAIGSDLGACCRGEDGLVCELTTEAACILSPTYAVWMGVGTDCSDGNGNGMADICEIPGEEACCFGQGVCHMEPPAQCWSSGGLPMGAGTSCVLIVCPFVITGACCNNQASGLCTEVEYDQCTAMGGYWKGAFTTCEDADGDGVADLCEGIYQACCFTDGTCQMLRYKACLLAGGTPRGDGTTCTSVVCPAYGACCRGSDGLVCEVTTEAACITSPTEAYWMGAGTDCTDANGNGMADICEVPGEEACCFGQGVCHMVPPAQCLSTGGLPMGAGTSCVSVLCPFVITGACCDGESTGLCTVVEYDTCVAMGGFWRGANATCEDADGDGVADLCEGLFQACCFDDGTCRMLTYRACLTAGGTPRGDGTNCDSVICPPHGACCRGSEGLVCEITTEGECITSPTEAYWMGAGTNCTDANGNGIADVCEVPGEEACCLPGPTCVMDTPARCDAAGGLPMGPGSSCVITPCPMDPTGACCNTHAAPGCSVVTQPRCDAMGGEWHGYGSRCDDLDGDGVADVCESYIHEACCFPNGTCQVMHVKECGPAGGTPMGAGTNCYTVTCPILGACCYGDGEIKCGVMEEDDCVKTYKGIWRGPDTDCEDADGDHVADVCEPEACCYPDGSCHMVPAQKCLDDHGTPQGPGTACVGDLDHDGIDEACDAKWIQPPDLATTGVDVDATTPVFLADDFLCTQTEAITRICVWGSWRKDALPVDPANVNFTLRIYADVPASDESGPGYSMPGAALWSKSFAPYSFSATPFMEKIQEGFWDPSTAGSYFFPGDTVCWLYTFDIPLKQAFCQQGTPDKPVVYWLGVQASIPPLPTPGLVVFGWKTSTKHWNDNAVWITYTRWWNELHYPVGHPLAGKPVDLAFALEGQPCFGSPSDEREDK